jgi:hypothetical protein
MGPLIVSVGGGKVFLMKLIRNELSRCHADTEMASSIVAIDKPEHDNSRYDAEDQHTYHPVLNVSLSRSRSRHDGGFFGGGTDFSGFGHL